MGLLQDMASFLISKNCASGLGTDIFCDFTPDKPDNIVVLHEYQGSPDIPYEDWSNRSVQIAVRNIKAEEASNLAWQIYKELKTENRVVWFTEDTEDDEGTVTKGRFAQVYLRQTPFKIRTDENKRVYYGFNVGVTTRLD
jgi:hypothetical protein